MVVTHAEKRAWQLKIRDVKETDKGWYMVSKLSELYKKNRIASTVNSDDVVTFNAYGNKEQIIGISTVEPMRTTKKENIANAFFILFIFFLRLVPNQHG